MRIINDNRPSFYYINDDKISGVNVDKLGFYFKDFISPFPKNYDGIITVSRTVFSVGDWGVISGLPYALKQLHPNCKIAIPTPEWNRHVFNFWFSSGGNQSVWNKPWENSEIIFKNNPYIDIRFNVGEMKGMIFHDHHRVYTDNEEEPIVEQLLRFFGADDDQIKSIDSRPQLFFDEEEIKLGDEIIKKYIGEEDFGTLMLSTANPKYQVPWDEKIDKELIKEIKKYKKLKFFYYSQVPLEQTRYNFIKGINIENLNIPLRIQMYIKNKALINTGYQSGINDSIGTRNTKIICATPYSSLKSNIGRGIKYYNGNNIKCI